MSSRSASYWLEIVYFHKKTRYIGLVSVCGDYANAEAKAVESDRAVKAVNVLDEMPQALREAIAS